MVLIEIVEFSFISQALYKYPSNEIITLLVTELLL